MEMTLIQIHVSYISSATRFFSRIFSCYYCRYFHLFFRLPACYPCLPSHVILSPVFPEAAPSSCRSLSLFSIPVVIPRLRPGDADEVSAPVPDFRYRLVVDWLLRYTPQNQVLLTAVIRSQTNRRSSNAIRGCILKRLAKRVSSTSIHRGRFFFPFEKRAVYE